MSGSDWHRAVTLAGIAAGFLGGDSVLRDTERNRLTTVCRRSLRGYDERIWVGVPNTWPRYIRMPQAIKNAAIRPF